MSPVLFRRQDDVFVDDDPADDWWFSDDGYIVRWAIIGGIVFFFFAWFVGGHFHAKARLRQGKKPMLYHRFLVPQDRRPPRRNIPLPEYSLQQVESGYNVNGEAAPPYDPNAPLPPTYQGDGKPALSRSQSYDVPPPGPPPSQEQQEQQELPERPVPTQKATSLMQRINPFHK